MDVPRHGSLLLVDGAPSTERLVRIVRQFAPAVSIVQHPTYEEALPAVHDQQAYWVAFLFDVHVQSDSQRSLGVDLLELAREQHAAVPAAVMGSLKDHAAIRRSARLNATFVPKPVGSRDIRSLLARAAIFEMANVFSGCSLHQIAKAHGLSAPQAEVLVAHVTHLAPGQVRKAFGLSTSTHARLLVGIQERLGVESIDEACRLVMQRWLRRRDGSSQRPLDS